MSLNKILLRVTFFFLLLLFIFIWIPSHINYISEKGYYNLIDFIVVTISILGYTAILITIGYFGFLKKKEMMS